MRRPIGADRSGCFRCQLSSNSFHDFGGQRQSPWLLWRTRLIDRAADAVAERDRLMRTMLRFVHDGLIPNKILLLAATRRQDGTWTPGARDAQAASARQQGLEP